MFISVLVRLVSVVSIALVFMGLGDMPRVSAQPSASINGRVVRCEEKPDKKLVCTGVPDVELTAVNIDGTDRTRTTDEEGRFAFSLLRPSKYTIVAKLLGYGAESIVIQVDGSQSRDITLPEITLGQGKIRGRILDRNRKGVADARVIVKNKNIEWTEHVKQNPRETTTNADGSYFISFLSNGEHLITAMKPGVGSGCISNFHIRYNAANPTIEVQDITLRSAPCPVPPLASAEGSESESPVTASDSRPLLTIMGDSRLVAYNRPSEPQPSIFPGQTQQQSAPAQDQQDKAPARINNATPVTITGYILYPDKAPSNKAKIRVNDMAGRLIREVIPNRSGSFTIGHLQPGIYTITAEEDGYPPGKISLDTKSRGDLIIVLSITLGQTIELDNPPPPLPVDTNQEASLPSVIFNTTDATRVNNFTAKQLEALPLGGATNMRTFDECALLAPGVAPPPFTPGARGAGISIGVGTAGEFAVNGMRARSNNFSVDGLDNNDPELGVRRQGFITLVPQSIESINEFSVFTLLWTAEYGRNFGAQVNAATKIGGSKYHGQAYIFFTDSGLNAREVFDYTGGPSGKKDDFTRTQEGFTVGGPIFTNHTHFFSSFEHLGVNATSEQHFSTPLQQERRFFNANEFIVDDAGFNPQFIAKSGVTPLGNNILSLYPLPNNPGGPYGDNTFTEVLPADGDGNVFSIKLLNQFPKEIFGSLRYNFTNDDQVLPSINRAISSTIKAKTYGQNVSLVIEGKIAPRCYSQARFSFGRTELKFVEHELGPFIFSANHRGTVQDLTDNTLRKIPSETGPIGELIIEPFSPVGINAEFFPQGRFNNTFQYADVVSGQFGKHSLKYGADIKRVQLNSFQDRFYRPQVVYGSGTLRDRTIDSSGLREKITDFFLPGVQMAALGLASSVTQTITLNTPDSNIGLRFTDFNIFFNDNWSITPKFHLDYGLRYEYSTVPSEENNRIEDSLSLRNLPRPGPSRFEGLGAPDAFKNAVDAYRQVLMGRTKIYDSDRNNFGPHIGFAWDPGDKGDSIVRGGYGIYYDKILGAVVSQARNIFPAEAPLIFSAEFSLFDVFRLSNPSLPLFRFPEDSVPPVALIAPGTRNQFNGNSADFFELISVFFTRSQSNEAPDSGGLAFTLPARNLRTPYAQQWHLTYERELQGRFLFSASYVGTKGSKLLRLTTPNGGPNPTTGMRIFLPRTRNSLLEVVAAAVNIQPIKSNLLLGSYRIFETSASSTYHALQLEARKHYVHSLTFTLAYTWSHALDYVSDVFPIAGAPILPQNSHDFRLEHASANFDIRHRFAGSLVWDLPFYRESHNAAARLLGGWQISTIFQAHRGQPFTLNIPADANFDGNLTDRPSTTKGLAFFNNHGSQRVAVLPGFDVNDFFTFGKEGATGRNTVRGDNFINWDMALTKNLKIEGQQLRLRVEIFNLLNRSNFGLPIRTIGAPGFGSSVDTVNPARAIQFALKYSF